MRNVRLYRRGGSPNYWLDLRIDGKRIKRSTGTPDERQAQEYAAKVATDYWRQIKLGDAPSRTWDEAAVDWIKAHQHLAALNDRLDHIAWLTKHLHGRLLSSITVVTVDQLIDARVKEGAKKRTKKGEWKRAEMGNGTVNRYMADLGAVLNHVHAKGWILGVPKIRKLQEAKKRVSWLTLEQAAALIKVLPDHLRVMAQFSLATGLRESNVRLLEWSQVDLERGLAWIHGDQAKASKPIAVPLNDQALGVLYVQKGKHKRYIFAYRGAPVTKCTNTGWNKATKKAGLVGFHFHDLRHTWASWHTQNGTPQQVLKELGGWSSMAMVERYSHLGMSHLAEYAGNISGYKKGYSARSDDASETQENSLESLGWLMGLEPTTTGITKRTSASTPRKPASVLTLRHPKKRKAA